MEDCFLQSQMKLQTTGHNDFRLQDGWSVVALRCGLFRGSSRLISPALRHLERISDWCVTASKKVVSRFLPDDVIKVSHCRLPRYWRSDSSSSTYSAAGRSPDWQSEEASAARSRGEATTVTIPFSRALFANFCAPPHQDRNIQQYDPLAFVTSFAVTTRSLSMCGRSRMLNTPVKDAFQTP